MARVTNQSCLLFLVGLFLRANEINSANPNVKFPFAHAFRSRLIAPDDDGVHMHSNVTFSDNDGTIASYDTKDLENWPGSACVRECGDNSPPRICYYAWTLELWNVLGP